MKYVALLRGINVGGKNIIKMSELKECFEEMGFGDVRTYIQSGNVIFTSTLPTTKLETKIESELSKTFDYKLRVVVIKEGVLANVLKKAPKSFGTEQKKYKYDVVFLKSPLTPSKAIKVMEVKEGVDTTYKGMNVLYFRRLVKNLTQSRLSKIISKPEYQYMTIRNWNTTSKLLTLLRND